MSQDYAQQVWKMPQLINIDDMLESWDKIKDCAIPTPCTLDEALKFSKTKDDINSSIHSLRVSRMQMDSLAEEFWTKNIIEQYEKFNKEFVFRILKT